MDATELKQHIEDQQKAVKEFREELSKTRQDHDKVARIEAALNTFESKNQEITKAAAELRKQLDEVETKLNRAQLGAQGGETAEVKKARESKAAFFEGYSRQGVEKMSAEQKALLVSSDTGGGYLAPPEYVAEVIKAEVLYSPFRSIVRVRQTSAGEVQQPKRTGTAAATRVGETTTRGESQNPSWGMLKVGAPELYAEARVSFTDLEDSAFDLEAMLRDEFAEQFGVKEGTEVVSGNGVNQMLGFLDANAAGPGVPIAYTPSGQAATIKGAAGAEADALTDFFHAIKTAYAVRGTWVFNRKTLGVLRKLKDTTGAPLWQPGLNGAAANTIMGAPYVECPDMPDEGANAFPIAFGDWQRAFMIVDRVSMAVTRDPFTVANAGQVKFSARRRVGGQVMLGEAIRLFKCAAS